MMRGRRTEPSSSLEYFVAKARDFVTRDADAAVFDEDFGRGFGDWSGYLPSELALTREAEWEPEGTSHLRRLRRACRRPQRRYELRRRQLQRLHDEMSNGASRIQELLAEEEGHAEGLDYDDRARTDERRWLTRTGAGFSLMLAVLFAGEFALTRVVLARLGAPQLVTDLLVLAVQVTIIVAGHAVGGLLRDMSRSKSNQRPQRIVLLVLLVVTFGLTAWGLSEIRVLTLLEDQEILRGNLRLDGTDGLRPVSFETAMLMLGGLQALFFLVAVWIGWRRHAPDVDRLQLTRARRRIEEQRNSRRQRAMQRKHAEAKAMYHDMLSHWLELRSAALQRQRAAAVGMAEYRAGLVAAVDANTAARIIPLGHPQPDPPDWTTGEWFYNNIARPLPPLDTHADRDVSRADMDRQDGGSTDGQHDASNMIISATEMTSTTSRATPQDLRLRSAAHASPNGDHDTAADGTTALHSEEAR